MRRITAKTEIRDQDGHVWKAWITVPEDEGRGPSHGPDEPCVTIHTPDEPEHAFYGEEGPTFPVSVLLRAIGCHPMPDEEADVCAYRYPNGEVCGWALWWHQDSPHPFVAPDV